MKFASVDDRAALVVDKAYVDIAKASSGRFGPDPMDVFDAWSDFVVWAQTASLDETLPLDPAHLGAPSPRPRQVFGIGLNYRTHAEETGATLPAIPAVFTKYPTCISGPYTQVELPSGWVDWEVELVVIIGARCDRVDEADALEYVAGWTVGQDLSERRVQTTAGGQFCLGKSYRGFGPMGPWMITRDELPDGSDLGLGCSIDGETMQDARTSDMVFSVRQLIAQISAILPMLPGDVIFTGTPSGVGVARDPRRFLSPGEVLESWIDGIGTLRTTLVAAS